MNKPYMYNVWNTIHADEVKAAVKSMKNNKSCGIDKVKAELIKYGNHKIIEEIARLLNIVAKTGKYPKEIKKGLLVPLPSDKLVPSIKQDPL